MEARWIATAMVGKDEWFESGVCAHLDGRMQGPRLDAQPEDADGELDQFAPRRCFRLSSGTSTLPGQPDEGSLAMGSSSDGATSVRRGAIPTAKRRRLSGPRSRATCNYCSLTWRPWAKSGGAHRRNRWLAAGGGAVKYREPRRSARTRPGRGTGEGGMQTAGLGREPGACFAYPGMGPSPYS